MNSFVLEIFLINV